MLNHNKEDENFWKKIPYEDQLYFFCPCEVLRRNIKRGQKEEKLALLYKENLSS